MSEETIVRAEIEIDSELRDRAGKVFNDAGLSFEDAFRLLVTRTAEDGVVPYGLQDEDPAYDAWYRAKVQEALDETGPFLSHEDVNREMEVYKAELLQKHSQTGA